MFLGIDTSNYTTSAALYDFKKGEIIRKVSEDKLVEELMNEIEKM